MRRAVAAAILIVLGLALQGCMPPKMVRTSATAFYVSEYKAAGTIAVLSSDSKTAESLEFAHFKSLVEAKLRAAGYSIADPISAQYLALLAYGIDSGKTATVPIPVFGQTGGGATYTIGTVSGAGGSANYSGTSYTMPTYGVVGTSTGTVMVYSRAIAIDIVDAKSVRDGKPEKVYEGRAKSVGTCSSIAPVFRQILEAIFEGFPGGNGKTRTAEFPLGDQC